MKTVGLLVLSFTLILVGFEPAVACWCARKTLYNDEEFRAAVAEEFRGSSAVFSGEVTGKNQTQVTFKVAKVWKGTVAKEVKVSSDFFYMKEKGETSLVLCAYSSFEIGKNYLVYADLFENRLQVHECSRTQLLNKAERDVKGLEELGAPVDCPTAFSVRRRPFQSMAKSNQRLRRTRGEWSFSLLELASR